MLLFDGTHLTSTDMEELHAFAESVGLKREWFQDHRIPHYDVWGYMKKKVSKLLPTISSKELIKKYRKDENGNLNC